jgi:hypothetical protein
MRVYEKNGIKLGKGNLDRTTGSVVAVVIMHLAHISLLKSRPHADHPLSVKSSLLHSYHLTKEVITEV